MGLLGKLFGRDESTPKDKTTKEAVDETIPVTPPEGFKWSVEQDRYYRGNDIKFTLTLTDHNVKDRYYGSRNVGSAGFYGTKVRKASLEVLAAYNAKIAAEKARQDLINKVHAGVKSTHVEKTDG